MESVDSYLADILAAIRPLPPRELGLDEADGAVLAEDVTAAWPLPPFDNSAMDGYAVLAADVAAATPERPVTLPVRGEVPAGDTRPHELAPGTCLRIMTGAPLPSGADAVVPVEWTDGGARAGHDRPRRRARARDPADRRRRRPGRCAADRGHAARPGAARPARGRRPRHRPRPPPAAGHGDLDRERAHRARAAGHARPDLGVQQPHAGRGRAAGRRPPPAASRSCRTTRRRCWPRSRTRWPTPTCWSPAAASAWAASTTWSRRRWPTSARSAFRKVAMQPGMPQGFGVVGPDGTPIFTLPGNPVSAYVSFQLFVRPAAGVLQSFRAGTPRRDAGPAWPGRSGRRGQAGRSCAGSWTRRPGRSRRCPGRRRTSWRRWPGRTR